MDRLERRRKVVMLALRDGRRPLMIAARWTLLLRNQTAPAASPASITIAATLFPTVMLSMETSLKLSLCWTQPSLVVKTLGVGS